jgi:hypothetical protein
MLNLLRPWQESGWHAITESEYSEFWFRRGDLSSPVASNMVSCECAASPASPTTSSV